MARQQTNLITARTAAATSAEFYAESSNEVLTLISNGYTGAEKATIQVKDPQTDTWQDTSLILDVDNNPITLPSSAASYRINKEITTGAVAVTLIRMR